MTRFLRALRRASRAVRTALAVLLLALAYVTRVPPLALARRLARRPRAGWRRRDDPTLASAARLRRLF